MILEGQVAFVLGGARGIGKAYCESLLKRKVKVCCSDLLEEVGKKTELELQQKYGRENFTFCVCDGTNAEQIRESLKFTREHFGRLDIVINNVGSMGEEDWEQTLNINLGTTCRVTEAAMELLSKNRGGPGGVLIHTSSNGGLVPQCFAPVYCALKTATIQYVRAWSHTINYEDHGIRMFTMCPSMTNTDFVDDNYTKPGKILQPDVCKPIVDKTKQGYMLKPEEVGEAMAGVLEDDSLNGVAVQMIHSTPQIWYAGDNSGVSLLKRYESVQKN